MELNGPVKWVLIVGVIAVVLFGINTFLPKAGVPVNGSPPPKAVSKDGLTLAPELTGISGYINAPAGFKLSDAKGKVILVDFWTFSCINCIRTQPYLNAWQEKYADKGLVIVGVHTPEFDFEKKLENVQEAVKKAGITYPVVLDNDFATWSAYANRYWPHKYLIDAEGYIRYDHIGEGGYEETEEMIQQLLKERDAKIALGENEMISDDVDANTPDTEFEKIQTPEIYLGYQFARQPIGNPEGFKPEQTVAYTLPSTLERNQFYLDGNWTNKSDYMELASDTGKIVLPYHAKNVNIVAGTTGVVSVELDGNPISATEKGKSVTLNADGSNSVKISSQQLYSLVEDTNYFDKTITITVSGKGFRIYTFTFG